MNKLCHKKMNVSRFQDIGKYTVNAPALSDIDGSGPREESLIFYDNFYNIAHVFSIDLKK